MASDFRSFADSVAGQPARSSFEPAFVGRQPILDGRLATYGYELLYRRGTETTARFENGDSASAEVALDAFLEFGLDTLAGDRRAFINVTRAVLLSGFCRELPRDRVVLEVLESVPCDPQVIREVQRLTADGYQVALDDYVPGDHRHPLVPAVAIVKVDIAALDNVAVASVVAELSRPRLSLVAERVETLEDVERCHDLGFSYFQGFFFARPATMTGRRIPVERLTALRILASLDDPNTPLDTIAAAVATDVKLSYQLLRAANSAARASAQPIDCLSTALLRIGRDQLRAWLSVLALSGITGKPPALLGMALTRARMCEALAQSLGEPAGSWFMAGLFSALDLLFDTPLERLLGDLPVAPDVARALVHRSGRLGDALNSVLAFERGCWATARCHTLSVAELTDAYRSALEWVRPWERELRPEWIGG